MRSSSDTADTLLPVRRKPAATAEPQAGAAIAARFHIKVRKSIRSFVASSPRAADLANVFPAAAYVIASKTAPLADVDKATRLTLEGAPLREVARTLGLPLWLRRLPPEAFRAPLGPVPSSDMFTRRIANHLPVPAQESAFWLTSVAFAAKSCDEYFALWLAGQRIFMDQHRDPDRLFAVLAAYAWFSTADRTRGNSLIVTPWRPEMAFDTAVCAAKSWLNRVRLTLQLRDGAVTDTWLKPGEVNGLSFQPLLSANDILAESRAMQNCADQYSDRVARDKCRLFSVRRRGVRVATLEIGPHAREPHMLAINQLKARHNLPAASEIWQTAHAWLATQPELRRTPPLSSPDRPLNAAAWTSLMQPYRASKDGARWLPAKPTVDAFAILDSYMADLARRGGVSSWLFT
jgi:hypothetical protein